MANEKTRILKLFYILTSHEGFITSLELAQCVGVSERTVKSDIKELMDFALASGSHIESKKGKGYRLIIDENDVYEPVKNQLSFHFGMLGSASAVQKTRVNDIIRRIICEQHYMTLDDIADELYLTKSALREDSKEVRKFLDFFNLRIKNVYEEGPLVIGSEYNRRAAMLCVFENHYHEALTLYKDNDYLQWFDYDQQERYEIRRLFLKILRESECSVRDDHTQRLARYLCLMVNRYNAGFRITYTKEQRSYIMQFRQYEVTKNLFEKLNKIYDINVDENEICAFAFQLIAFADISLSVDVEKYYGPILPLAIECSIEVMKLIKQRYSIDLSFIKEALPLFTRAIIPLLVQQHFDTTLHLIRNVASEDERILLTPFATYLSFELNSVFQSKFNCSISLYNLVTFSSFIQKCIMQIDYPYIPVRVAVTTSEGINSSELLASIIRKRFSGWFECLDTYQLYELRGVDRSKYDYVILNFALFSYKYDWPYISMDVVPTQEQLNQLYNEAILSGVKIDLIIDKFNIDKVNIYDHFMFSSLEYFIDSLSYKHGKDSSSIRGIKRELQQICSAFIHKKIMLLWINRNYVYKDFIEVYQLDNEHECNNCSFKNIIVLSLDINYELRCLRFINDLLFMILNNSEYIERLINSGSKDILVDCVKDALKALPIALD